MFDRLTWSTALSLILSFLMLYPANAQSTDRSEPFTTVKDDQNLQTTPEQSNRLKRIRDLPTTKAVHILRANGDLHIGSEVKISIPNDRTLVFSKNGGETIDSNDFTWFGVEKGEKGASATLIARKGEISGSINTSKAIYRITPLGDGLYAMSEMDTKRLPPEEPTKAPPKS